MSSSDESPEYPSVKKSDSSVIYMPQLNSLRTIAVGFVLIEHWLPERTWLKLIPFGMLGVTLFFVLSGFLITQILLNNLKVSHEKNISISHLIKQFYIRRTLRIFPIYYITIFVLFILNIQNIRSIFSWFFFYVSNIYFYINSEWAGPLSHFWTLAVEEQFYIIWPVIILFIPKKHLLKAIGGIILIGPVSRILLYLISSRTDTAVTFIHVLTPTCMDCFGFGALLAFCRIFIDNKFQFNGIKSFLLLLVNILLITVLLFNDESVISVLLFRFSVSIVFLILVSKVSIGFTGPLRSIFENRTIMYLGKISYGIYLFHKFIPMIYSALDLPVINDIYLKFFVYSVILIFISSLSWFLIEKPVNNLKRKYSYT